jgi:hypothetical protein
MGWSVMRKKILIYGVVSLLLVVYFSGCTEQSATKQKTEPLISTNTPPIIQECRADYFDRLNSPTIFFVGVASDSDGSVVLYSWNLSDGFTIYSQSFSHTFSRSGLYHATLTVTDNEGATNTSAITVYVYDSAYENEQQDKSRIIGRWTNTQGTLIEFTSNGEFITLNDQIHNRYWFTSSGLFIIFITTNETLRYEYLFQTDNTLVFYRSGQSQTNQDTWTRTAS